ncbi:MAG TPA: glycosyltransferase family 4 protein [Candidatus Binatia bacterium]|nr:glycosyltransferase family 4 protein [Candidatus Binatia bacterium]
MSAAHFRPAPAVAIVAACRFPAPRGSQVLIDGMAAAYADAGIETHLVAPMAGSVARPYRTHAVSRRLALAPPADPVAWPRSARLLFDAALAMRLLAVVRREKIAVVHAHNYEALVAALLVRAAVGTPVVFHAHAALADELPLYASVPVAASGGARRFGAWCDRALPRLADRVVVLSEDVANYLRTRGVAPERLAVVPPAIDAAPFAGAERRSRARRAVFAGNLDPYQNLSLLLDAWADASRRRGAAELRIVTHASGDRLARAIARRRLGGAVRVVPAWTLPDVSRELAGGSVGISPRQSWSGFPIKTLNYMASALPTVALAASAKGIRDGETGWVVRDATAAGLGAALHAALDDDAACARRGRAAREVVRDCHSWQRVAPALLEVSRQAADAPA